MLFWGSGDAIGGFTWRLVRKLASRRAEDQRCSECSFSL